MFVVAFGAVLAAMVYRAVPVGPGRPAPGGWLFMVFLAVGAAWLLGRRQRGASATATAVAVAQSQSGAQAGVTIVLPGGVLRYGQDQPGEVLDAVRSGVGLPAGWEKALPAGPPPAQRRGDGTRHPDCEGATIRAEWARGEQTPRECEQATAVNGDLFLIDPPLRQEGHLGHDGTGSGPQSPAIRHSGD